MILPHRECGMHTNAELVSACSRHPGAPTSSIATLRRLCCESNAAEGSSKASKNAAVTEIASYVLRAVLSDGTGAGKAKGVANPLDVSRAEVLELQGPKRGPFLCSVAVTRGVKGTAFQCLRVPQECESSQEGGGMIGCSSAQRKIGDTS